MAIRFDGEGSFRILISWDDKDPAAIFSGTEAASSCVANAMELCHSPANHSSSWTPMPDRRVQLPQGLVKSYRVKRGGNAYVSHQRNVIVPPAVAVGRDINDEVDMQTWLALDHSQLIPAVAQGIFAGAPYHPGGVILAHSHTLPAAGTFVIINVSLPFGSEVHCVMCTVDDTHVATGTVLFVDHGRITGVKEQLASHGGTSHTEVLQSTAETCLTIITLLWVNLALAFPSSMAFFAVESTLASDS